MNGLNEEIHQKNETISKIENEIVKRNAIIERKQSTIDQYNKKIDQLRSKDGVSGRLCRSQPSCSLAPLLCLYSHVIRT